MKEDWQEDFEWLQLRHEIKKVFGKGDLPDLNAILFLTGLQEYGIVKEAYSKEEKQDLMHIAICSLFEEDGYFKFEGRDAEGWPHFKQTKKINAGDLAAQEQVIKQKLIKYYKNFLNDHAENEN